MENEDDVSFHSEEEEGSSEDDSSVDSDEDYNATLQGIRENDAETTELDVDGDDNYIQNMIDDEWEELGRDVSNNTHLTNVTIESGALNDHVMSFLFRGLKRSSSIKELWLFNNDFSLAGIRSMMPFLQSASNLTDLYLCNSNIQSEGFNLLWRALRNSPIAKLGCSSCGIESIDIIDRNNAPKYLTYLNLRDNRINADGCRELAKLLQGEDSTLTDLYLDRNKIDDEGVDNLVASLRTNTTLKDLHLQENLKISNQGQIMLLKLVNDVSSIKAILRSNHTLRYLPVYYSPYGYEHIQMHIDQAVGINHDEDNSEAAGWMKIIDTQLHSGNRAELAELQGVSQSLYSEINPLHLPEVLALVGLYHGLGELYVALKSSIAGVISIVNRKECLKQEKAAHEALIAEQQAIIAQHRAIIAQHRAKVETIEAEIATIEEAGGSNIL